MRARSALVLALSLSSFVTACDKQASSATPDTGDDQAQDAQDTEETSTDEARSDEAKWATRLEAAEAKAAESKSRWTPELESSLTALLGAEYASSEARLEAVLASGHRAPGNAERDAFRHPAQTLAFFGIEPDMKVFEFAQGAGWYTELLAPYLAGSGELHLAVPKPDDSSARGRYSTRATELFYESAGNLYAEVVRVEQAQGDAAPVVFGADGSLDAILVFRMMHNIHRFEMWERLMPPAFAALKPGGVLAVVQHRAPEGGDVEAWAAKGYMPEAWLIEKVQSYGFELAERAEINANPKDTKDYEGGVWTLPPTLGQGDEDRAKYVEIGESDRSTLRFVKPN